MAEFGSIAPEIAGTQAPAVDWHELLLRLAAANQIPGVAMPQGFVRSEGAGMPRVGGSVSMPAFGGELGLRGEFSRPDRYTPTDWSAILNYKRRF